jgi:hypothetical protein
MVGLKGTIFQPAGTSNERYLHRLLCDEDKRVSRQHPDHRYPERYRVQPPSPHVCPAREPSDKARAHQAVDRPSRLPRIRQRSYEYHRLGIRDLKSASASRIRTEEHVVYAYHVIAGLSEFGAVEFIGAAGQLFLLGAPQPADIELKRLAALRARISGRLCFLLLRVVVSFIHNACSLHPNSLQSLSLLSLHLFDQRVLGLRATSLAPI